MNTFKYKKAVKECKRLRSVGDCPRACASFHTHDRRVTDHFCRDAFAAERRK